MPNTLINVSNRLPVTVEEDRVTKSSGGLVAALEGLPEEQYKTKWIGWPGAAFPEESRRPRKRRTTDFERVRRRSRGTLQRTPRQSL
jgi:trehalose-6-phosphate synthase